MVKRRLRRMSRALERAVLGAGISFALYVIERRWTHAQREAGGMHIRISGHRGSRSKKS